MTGNLMCLLQKSFGYKKKTLPAFYNIKELQEFWDSHDFTNFQHEFSETQVLKFNIKHHSHLPITTEIYEKVEKIANKQKTSVDHLIQHWIQEKLETISH